MVVIGKVIGSGDVHFYQQKFWKQFPKQCELLGFFLGNNKLQRIVNYCELEAAEYNYQRQCFILVCISQKYSDL